MKLKITLPIAIIIGSIIFVIGFLIIHFDKQQRLNKRDNLLSSCLIDAKIEYTNKIENIQKSGILLPEVAKTIEENYKEEEKECFKRYPIH